MPSIYHKHRMTQKVGSIVTAKFMQIHKVKVGPCRKSDYEIHHLEIGTPGLWT